MRWTYTVTLTATDGHGNNNACTTTVTVNDTRPAPVIVYADPAYIGLLNGTSVLWPAGVGPTTALIGCDAFATIQDAVNRVADNVSSVVNVAAGNYSEQVLIQKSLNLVGAGIGQSIVKAPASGRLCAPGHTDDPWETDYLLAAYVESPSTISVKVSGFTFDANNQMHNCDRFTGVFFKNVKGATIGAAGLFDSKVTGFNVADPSCTGVRTLEDSLLTVTNNQVDYTINGIATYGDFEVHPSPQVAIAGQYGQSGGNADPLWVGAGHYDGLQRERHH